MKTLGILLTLSWFYNWKHSRKCFVGLYRDIYTLRFNQWKFIKKVHLFLYITSGIGMVNALCRENRLHFLSIFIYLFYSWHVSNHFNPDTLRFKTTVYCLLLWIRISSRGRLINTCCFFRLLKLKGSTVFVLIQRPIDLSSAIFSPIFSRLPDTRLPEVVSSLTACLLATSLLPLLAVAMVSKNFVLSLLALLPGLRDAW
mgnify:CR=1 FL=1